MRYMFAPLVQQVSITIPSLHYGDEDVENIKTVSEQF